jgi:two-component system, chemotaxis family, chemotaxis protein CheY
MPQTVLIMDDSAILRIQAGRALTRAGFQVVEAVDGLDGLAKLKSNPDVVLIVCDVNMPRMSGIEFLEELAQRGGTIPAIVMLTTEGNPALIDRAVASGAKGWIIKPFNPDFLVATAKKLSSGG